jgi:four helix bundle protein
MPTLALGSCGEVRNHLTYRLSEMAISSEEQYEILDEKFLEVIKMLYGYIKRLKPDLDNKSDISES